MEVEDLRMHASASDETGDPATRPLARSVKSVDKRDKIMRAAIEVINCKSYALATMHEIAASLSLRDATLYYYFPNKQALAYACHVRSLERFATLIDACQQKGRNGAQALEWLLKAMIAESSRNGPLLYFGDYSYLNVAQRRFIDGSSGVEIAKVEQIVRSGIADGSIIECEPQLVVRLLLGMLVWLAKWVPSVEDLTADRLMRAMTTLVFHGLESRDTPAVDKPLTAP